MSEFTTEQIHAKTDEIVGLMAAGKDVEIGGYSYSSEYILNKLAGSNCCASVMALIFARDEAERVEAWLEVSKIIEQWAVECLEFEKEEAERG